MVKWYSQRASGVAYIFSLMTFQVNRVCCDDNAGHAAAFIHLIRVDAVGHTVCLIC